MTRWLEGIGRAVLAWLGYVGEVMLLLFETLRQMKRPPRMRLIFSQMAHLGVDTLPIVALTLLFTGMVMTLQIVHEFIRFGAQATIGGVIAIAIGRELGPVLVGVVAAGRAGAAITAMSNVTGKITAAGGVQVPGITFNGAKVTASESAANTSTGGGSRPKVEINFNGLVAGNPLEIARQIRRLLENEKELTGV